MYDATAMRMRRDARSRRSIYGLRCAGAVARLLLPPMVPEPYSPSEIYPIASLVGSTPARRRRPAASVGQVRRAVRPSASAAPPSYRPGYTATGGSSGAPLHGTRGAFHARSRVLRALQLTQLSGFSLRGRSSPPSAGVRSPAVGTRVTAATEVRNVRKRLCPGVNRLDRAPLFDIAACSLRIADAMDSVDQKYNICDF